MEKPKKKKSESFDKLKSLSRVVEDSTMQDENLNVIQKSKTEKSKSELLVTQITMQEIWAATKPIVHKNKKKYTRKGNKDLPQKEDI